MRSQFGNPKLGLVAGWLLLIAWTSPAFGGDIPGKDIQRGSGTEPLTLGAKQLSDAELDQITAGFTLFPPTPITSIPNLGSPAADSALGTNFTPGDLGPRAGHGSVMFFGSNFSVGLPAIQ